MGSMAVPSCRGGQCPTRRRDHGHAHQCRGDRRVRVVAVRPVLRWRRHDRDDDDIHSHWHPAGRRARDLPRSRRPGDGVHPHRPVRRGPRPQVVFRSVARPARARRERCRPTRRRRRTTSSGQSTDRRGYRPGPAGGEDPLRWTHHRRVLCDRREYAHRRIRPGRGRCGFSCGGRDGQRRRPAHGGDHPRGRRHRTGPDAATDGGSADRESPSAASRRPGVRDLRSHRDPAGHRRVHRLVAARRVHGVGVHRRGRDAHHRLPVRARVGDSYRVAGGHRPRLTARHPDPGTAGAGADPQSRHDRARQDRHRHHRHHGRHRRPLRPRDHP